MAPDQHAPAQQSRDLARTRARAVAVRAFVVVVVGCGAAAAVYAATHQTPTPPRLETAVVDTGDVVSRVSATGALSAVTTVQVGAQVSGRIAELLVDFNAPVKKGQLLARLDPATFEAAVKSAEANLAVAEAARVRAEAVAAQTKKQAERLSELVSRQLVAPADVEAAQASAASAAAEVASASCARCETPPRPSTTSSPTPSWSTSTTATCACARA